MQGVKNPIPVNIYQKKILAVEGKDEREFFGALLNCLGINDVQILDIVGKDKYKEKIPVLVQTEGFSEVTILAIVRDADTDAKAAFESIANILDKLSLKPPNQRGDFSDGNPRVGIFIMPGDSNEGMLEDLCLRTSANHPAMKCVDAFGDCVSKLENPPKNMAKAKAQAFLAAMPDIANCVGIGAQKGCWDFDSPELNDLKAFISNLK